MEQEILVIEDNEQNLYLITYILNQNGFQVTAARDGKEGIEKAKKAVPLMVLLDIQLPLMDGYEVARRLRKNQKLKDTPIVAVTSYAMVGDREKALAAGCTGYIEKPINPDTFMDEIKKYLTLRDDEGSL